MYTKDYSKKLIFTDYIQEEIDQQKIRIYLPSETNIYHNRPRSTTFDLLPTEFFFLLITSPQSYTSLAQKLLNEIRDSRLSRRELATKKK